ncbi:protein kinase [Nocardia sp. NPDC003269]|uniref:protein kinase domain-containing protein n=1 Tax=unclassified Nocardia TaxID=2637762 RepID=UPI0036871D44
MQAPGSRTGSRFGPYELRSMLGKGGMGEVYEAYDTGKDRVVALKLLAPELAQDPAYQVRFRRESQAAAKLAEPHVIPIHDWGVIDGVLFIDMRLVPGTDLRSVLHTGGPLSPERAVAVVEQIAAALDAAHAGGLVHRDVKPANILVTPADFAYLADFGIAHTEGDSAVTQAGMAMGSYIYMAPERFDVGPISHRADVYSLACVLHECLTGASPFPAASMSVLIRAHLSEAPPRPSEILPGLPTTLDEVIARGMAKDPADRYPSAGALAVAARDGLAAAMMQGGAPLHTPGTRGPVGSGQSPFGAAGAAFGAAAAATGARPVPPGGVVAGETTGGSSVPGATTGGRVVPGAPAGATTGGRAVPGATTGGRAVPGGTPDGATTGGRNVSSGAATGGRPASGGTPAGSTAGGRAVPGAPGEDAQEPTPTPTGEFRVVGAVTATGGIETSRSQTSATGAQPTLIIRPPAVAPGPAETTGFHRIPVEGTGEVSIPAVIQPTGPAEIRVADTHFTPLPSADEPPAPEPPPAYTPDQGLPKMRPFPDAHLYGGAQPGDTSGPVPAPPFPGPTGFVPPDPDRPAPPPRLDAPSGPVPQRAAPTQRFGGDGPVPETHGPSNPNPRFAPTQQYGDQPPRFESSADLFDDSHANPGARPGDPARPLGDGRAPGGFGPDGQRFDHPDARFASPAGSFDDAGPTPAPRFAPTQKFDADQFGPDARFGGPADVDPAAPERDLFDDGRPTPAPGFAPPQRFDGEQFGPDAMRAGGLPGAPARFGGPADDTDPPARFAAPTEQFGGTPDRFGPPTEQYDPADPLRSAATQHVSGANDRFGPPIDPSDAQRSAATQHFGGAPDDRFGRATEQYDQPRPATAQRPGTEDHFGPATEHYDPKQPFGGAPGDGFGSATEQYDPTRSPAAQPFGGAPDDGFGPATEQYDPQRSAATQHFGGAPDDGFGPATEQYDPQRAAATQHFGGSPDGLFPATEQFDPAGIEAQRSAPTQHYQGGADPFDDQDPQRAQATRQYRGGAAPFPAHQAPDDPARAAATQHYAGGAPDAYSQYDDPHGSYGDHAYRDPNDPYGPDPGYAPDPAWQQRDSGRRRSPLLPILVGVLAVVVLAIGGAIGWRLMSAADSAETTSAAPSSAAPGSTGGAPGTTAPRATTAAPTTSAGPVTLPAGAQPCESGAAAGAFGKAAVGTAVTSCGFAEAVRAAYVSGGTAPGPRPVVAASPVTGRTYTMTCTPEGKLVTCTGGENAVVYVY